jgi:hypothetical protein
MITAVMQPYLFPYIGYYQLVYASDYFIFYDDVSFIKQGYINRNNILVNGKQQRITLPVTGASSNTNINELTFQNSRKLIKTLEQTYRKSRYFQEVFPSIKRILELENRCVSRINYLSIKYVFDYLGIDKIFQFSSKLDYSREMNRSDRLIEMTKVNSCEQYINSLGGYELYDKIYFKSHGVRLSFLEAGIFEYGQGVDDFVPYLSMIDILMHCSKEEIIAMLQSYKLV